MNIWSLPALVAASVSLYLAIIIIVQYRSDAHSPTLAALNAMTFLWQCGTFFLVSSLWEGGNVWCYRLAYLGVVFIPPAMFHFTVTFFNYHHQQRFVAFLYAVSAAFYLPLSTFAYRLAGSDRYTWQLWYRASLVHWLFLLYVSVLILLCAYDVLKRFDRREEKALEHLRKNFVLITLAVASIGIIDFITHYGLKAYPLGPFLFVTSNLLLFYIIFKYPYMDINTAIAKTGILSLCYLVVFGVPLIIAVFAHDGLAVLLGDRWWLVPLVLFVLFSSIAPYVAHGFIRRAESALLREQHRYQATMRRISGGMTLIKDLDRLQKLIVYVLTRIIKVDYAGVYLIDREKKQYVLKAKRGPKARKKIGFSIPQDSTFIRFLIRNRQPLIYEEMKRLFHNTPNRRPLRDVEFVMRNLAATIIVPSFIGNELIGFLILGDKLSGELYTNDDLNVFSVLANQAAIAFENAQFYEDLKIANAHLFHQSKLSALGQMASGMSHQINNCFNVLSIAGSAALMHVDKIDPAQLPGEGHNKELLEKIRHALVRIKENAVHGGEIVKNLLSYSRPITDSVEEVDVRDILNSALKLLAQQMDLDNITTVKDFDRHVPRIKGNYNQLQEVFFNLIHNAYKAMKSNLSGTLTISAYGEEGENAVTVEIRDTGQGIAEKDLRYIFVPFFTSSRKEIGSHEGYGLGLFVCQKIIAAHGGQIQVESQQGKGTTFTITLPVKGAVGAGTDADGDTTVI